MSTNFNKINNDSNKVSPFEGEVFQFFQSLPASSLWALDDATFKKQISGIVNANKLHYDSRLNFLEHSLDVICGNLGSFGLNTSLTIETLDPARVKKALRIAALFQGLGKTAACKGQVEHSVEFAVQELSENKVRWEVCDDEISLIKHLMLSNELYGQFLKRNSKMGFPEFQQKLGSAYSILQKENIRMKISDGDFRKLMFTLWMADASMRSGINRKRAHLYRSLHQKLDTLNYSKLSEIYLVKNSIIREKEALPNFSEVVQGVYRGGLPTEEGLTVLGKLQVKTLISFRRDENVMQAEGMGFKVISIPLDAGNPETFTEKAILSFLEVATKVENQPCFMHCLYGADRTGFMSAVYRSIVEGISQEEAIFELTRFKGDESEFLQPALIKRFKELDIQKLRSQLTSN